MREHTYLTRIKDETWNDLQRIKEQLDGQSINSLINQSLRMFRDVKMQEIAENKRRRNSLASMSGF